LLVFRDYLRAHPEAAQAYADIKRALANSSVDDIEAYRTGNTSSSRRLRLRRVHGAREHHSQGWRRIRIAQLPQLAQMRSANRIEECLSLEAKRKTSARIEYFAF